jgi:hypothetical protein
MPTTYNGIGTTYFRHRNRTTRQATCEFCGQFTTLTSYDTRLVFSVFFIPIIPLGKKHILDQCGRCLRHRVMSEADWQTFRQKAGADVETFNAAATPSDEQFYNALYAAQATGDNAAITPIVARMRKVMPPSAEREVAVGDVYRLAGDPAAAEESFKRALSMSDDPTTNAKMASLLLSQNRPDDAKLRLRHVLEGRDGGNIGLANALAQAYQSQGRHPEAIAIFDAIFKARPDLATDPSLQKARAASEKAGHSGKPIKAKLFVGSDGSMLKPPASRLRAIAIFAAILALIFGVFAGISLYKAGHRKVTLVGNLARAYAITIDSKPFTVPARGETKLTLAEGPHVVTINDPRYLAEEIRFTIEPDGFWGRPFSDRAFVINPDGTALIVDETLIYGGTARNGIAPTARIGEPYYDVPNIHYAFEEPPQKVKLNKGSSSAYRHHLFAVREPLTPIDLLAIAEKHGGQHGLSNTLARLLRDLDLSGVDLSELPEIRPDDPAAAVARERLKRLPDDAIAKRLLGVE